MRIVHNNEGFDVDGLYLALSYLDRLEITNYKVSYSWPGRITIHHKADYKKLKDTMDKI